MAEASRYPEVMFATTGRRASVALMHRLSITGMALALVACGLLVFLIFGGPEVHTAQCDGSVPGWMLEAGDYEGGGCAEVFPSNAAPPNADWTLYCLGYCMCQPGGDTVRGACEAAPFINETPEPPAFDVGAVQAHFVAQCAAPTIVDGLFCSQVKIGEMHGEGDTLHVPTTLRGKELERATAICDQVAMAHVGSDGRDLGYTTIAMGSRIGGRNLFRGIHLSCRVTVQ
jgi:hypothetical protein